MIEHTIFSDRKELNLMLFYLGSKGRGIENKYVHKERVFVKKIDDNTNNSQIKIHLEYLSRSSRYLGFWSYSLDLAFKELLYQHHFYYLRLLQPFWSCGSRSAIWRELCKRDDFMLQ